MRSNYRGKNNKSNNQDQVLQNKAGNLEVSETNSAHKDGIRYDYNDSSDFKN